MLVKLKFRGSILLVIAYHEIGKKTYWNGSIPKQLFEDEIKYLLKLGFKILPLCEALEIIVEEECDNHNRIAVLTFDDAYKGVYEIALPIMLKYNVRGTVYPVAGFVERGIASWASQIGFIIESIKIPSVVKIGILNKTFTLIEEYDKNVMLSYFLNLLPNLNVNKINIIIHELSKYISNKTNNTLQKLYENLMMSEDELKEMVELGFEVGGHGYWHLGLTNIDKKSLYQEVEKSLSFANKFMSKSTCKFRTFAYPYGLYDYKVINALKDVGFHAAVTTIPIINKIPQLRSYEIGRIPPRVYDVSSLSTFKAICLIYS
jgi:peptidoglycan/xylan/chitin deacetylase (PgdA/CDA1 family)